VLSLGKLAVPLKNWLPLWKNPGTAHASTFMRYIKIILRFLTYVIVYNDPPVQNISARGSVYKYVILKEL
jgi:hypothetical protein